MKAIKKSVPTPATQPLVSLCVIYRNNLDTIESLLASVKDSFDEYVFTDTGSTDGTRQHIEAFLKNRRGKVTDFTWVDDFSAARNHCFAAATGRWKMFLDSDDQLTGGDKIRRMCKALDDNHPQIEAAFFPYDYDVHENLFTCRLCKWDAGWKWVDAIHERLVKEGGATEPQMVRIGDITVKHKRKTEAEKATAIRRNARIAEREYAAATDKGYKARLARTIAMEMKMDNRGLESIPYVEEVYNFYPSHPEGRQAAADIMKFYTIAGRIEEASVWAKRAGPSYEALVAHTEKDYPKVIERQTRGHYIPQQTTHEGFMFEKVAANVALAEAALSLGYPMASVDRALNSVRADLREHPMVAAGTLRIRQVIDRITIVVPGTPQPFDTNSGGTMLGGSEEAVLYLSRALAAQGRNVRIYTMLPPTTVPGLDKHGVEWCDVVGFDPMHEHGTLVIWRSAHFAMQLMNQIREIKEKENAGVEGVVPYTGIRGSSFWLHDQHLGVDGKTALNICRAFDSVVVLSEYHKRKIIETLGGVDPGNMVVLSNGIVADQFEGLAENPSRDPMSCVYSSCPSRGLRTLLDMWPQVKAEVPKAKLDLYYDWSGLRDMQPELYADVVAKYEAVKHLDVYHHGGIGHAQLNAALANANVLAYSHFENPGVETHCVTVCRATAAGATVLTVPNGALPETSPHAYFEEDPVWYRERLIALLKSPDPVSRRVELAAEMLKRQNWDDVATKFSKAWTQRDHTA